MESSEPEPSPDAKLETSGDLHPDVVIATSSRAPWRLGHLMALIAGVAIFIWAFMVAGALIVTLAFVSGLGLLFGGATLWARRAAARQNSILSILAIAAEKGMPLAPAVAAFASQLGGRARRRVHTLATRLNSGSSLAESLGGGLRIFSRDSTLLAKVGEDVGRLPGALRSAVEMRAELLPASNAILAQCMYVLGMLLGIQVIVGFILYFIVPKYEAILRDFGAPLPAITVLAIDLSAWVVRGGLISFLIFIVEIALAIILPFRVLGWMNLEIPFLDRIFRRRHTALILRSLALSVEGGKPIEVGLESLSRHYPTAWVRDRLIHVLDDARQGQDWCAALWRQGLIRESDGALLVSARSTGNLAWALRELAETTDRRRLVRVQAALQVVFPLVVLLFGMFVLLMTVAYFSPLIVLIERLTEV